MAFDVHRRRYWVASVVAIVAVVGAVTALTHVLPLGFLFTAVGLATLARPRTLVLRVIAMVAPVVTLLPWLARSLGGPHVDPGMVFDPVDVRLAHLFQDTLGSGPVAASGASTSSVCGVGRA